MYRRRVQRNLPLAAPATHNGIASQHSRVYAAAHPTLAPS